jgi:hypothetical protein
MRKLAKEGKFNQIPERYRAELEAQYKKEDKKPELKPTEKKEKE